MLSGLRVYSADAVYRRIAKNGAWLAGSRTFLGLCSIAYLALAARALGPSEFGFFCLVLAYGQSVASFVQFQSWQGVIRYGEAHLAARNHGALARLIGLTSSLDVAMSVIGIVIVSLTMPLIAGWLDWSSDQADLAMMFSAVILLSTGATPGGVLRLFDRFDLLSYLEAVGPTIRVGGSFIGWLSSVSPAEMLAVWAIASLAQSVATWVTALIILRSRGEGVRIGPTNWMVAVSENSGIGQFLTFTNLSSSFSIVWTQIGTVAVGVFVGPAAAGQFRAAAKLTRSQGKLLAGVARVLYPEVMRLVVSRDEAALKTLITRTTIIGATAGVLVIVITAVLGTHVLALITGVDDGVSRAVLVVLSVSVAVNLARVGLEPVNLAHGRAKTTFIAQLVGATGYVVALSVLLPLTGVMGAALAAVLGSVLVAVVLAWACIVPRESQVNEDVSAHTLPSLKGERTITFARHGKPIIRRIKGLDILRPLGRRGIRDAERLREQLAEAGIEPTLYLTAISVRAWQTALILRRAGQRIVFVPSLWKGHPPIVLSKVLSGSGNRKTVCVVGHGTLLQAALLHLLPERQDELDPVWRYMDFGTALTVRFSAEGVDIANQHQCDGRVFVDRDKPKLNAAHEVRLGLTGSC